jgi:hypothetical protein
MVGRRLAALARSKAGSVGLRERPISIFIAQVTIVETKGCGSGAES